MFKFQVSRFKPLFSEAVFRFYAKAAGGHWWSGENFDTELCETKFPNPYLLDCVVYKRYNAFVVALFFSSYAVGSFESVYGSWLMLCLAK